MSKHRGEVNWSSVKLVEVVPLKPTLEPWIQCSGLDCTETNFHATTRMKKWYCPSCKFCLQFLGEL